MKKFLRRTTGTVGIFLAATAGVFAQQSGYTITGQIKNLEEGAVIELVPAGTHTEEKPVASGTVKNGKFEFKGSLDAPMFYLLRVAGEDYNGIRLMAENADINVSGSTKMVDRNGNRLHDFSDVTVSGSKSHTAFLKTAAVRNRLNVMHERYNNDNKAVLMEMSAARQKKDTVLQKQIAASEAYKKLEREERAFFDSVKVAFRAQILEHKDSWWGPFLMLNQYSYFTPDLKPIYEQFSTEAKNSYYGKKVYEELYPKSYIGLPAPSLAFTDQQQKQLQFASIAKGKKYVLVDFWASWCAPCRKAIPELKEMYKELGANIEIVSVSIDKDAKAWVTANDQEKLPWISVLDRQDISKAYGVKAIPAMFLLDDKGKVLAENVTIGQVKEKIK